MPTKEKKLKCPVVNVKSRKMLPKYTDEELGLLAAKVGLTGAQLVEIGNLANATYHYIGADLSEANGGKMHKRESLVEVVLDANYLETAANHSQLRIRPELKDWLDNKACKYDLGDVYAAVAAVAFPYPEYE